MTPETIARLRELLDKATPGPWTALPWQEEEGGADWNLWGPRPTRHPFDDNLRGDHGNKYDAALIAESRNALPAILDALAAERTARLAAEDALRYMTGHRNLQVEYNRATQIRAEAAEAALAAKDTP